MAAASPAISARPGAFPAAAPRASGGGLAYKWLVLLVLLPGLTVFLIDVTVVNVALATLGAAFGVGVATVQWAITGYALASGIATPMAAYMENRFTMKRVWIVALSLFTASSVICGLAPAFWVLIVGRVLQGFCGAMLLPMAVSTIFETFPGEERGQALGFFAIPIVAGPALGPTLGGYIITNWDWRLVFFINLPIGVVSVLLAIAFLRPGQPKLGQRFDTIGAILSTFAFGLTLYGLSRVSEDGWGSFTVQSLVGIGVFCLIAFIGYEVVQDQPLLDVRLFAIPQFLVSNIVGWVSTIALFGAEFMLPLYLQELRGLSAVDTGLMLLPQGLSVALAGPIAGRLVDRIGARYIVMFGFVLLAVNTFQLSNITLTTSFGELRWLLVIRGLGLGCTMQPTQLTALGAVPARLRTNASSLNNALRNTVQSFGIATLATIVQTHTVAHAAVLSWQVRGDTIPGLALAQLSSMLQQRSGLPAAGANVAAMGAMLGQIRQQATVLGFADAYSVTFIAAVAAFCLATLLPGRPRGGAARPDPGMMAGGH